MYPGFQPMLSAKDFDITHLTYPLLVSDKYDGIRNCQLPDLGGVSRKMEPIPNLALREYFNRSVLAGLDGELIVGDPTQHKVRQKTQGQWSRIKGEGVTGGEHGDVTFFVFDDFFRPEDGKFDRYSNAAKRLLELNDPHIKLIEQKLVWNPEQLLECFRDAEARGFEGIMVADMMGRYKFGRESVRYDRAKKKLGVMEIPELLLGKVKSFADEEAEIVGFEEELENLNEKTRDALGHAKRSTHKENKVGKGRLGAFILSNSKYPKTFKCGTGLTHAQRQDFWDRREELLGQQLTFSYQPSGMDQVPQFTSFVDLRLD
jgi:DNA ligase-1